MSSEKVVYDSSFQLKVPEGMNASGAAIHLNKVSHRHGGDCSYETPFMVISSSEGYVSIGCRERDKDILMKDLARYLRNNK